MWSFLHAPVLSTTLRRVALAAAVASGALGVTLPTSAQAADGALGMSLLGRYSTGVFDEGAAEIPAYDAATKRLFVVNGHLGQVDVIDVAVPAAPVKVGFLDLSTWGSAANSVAAHGGVIAVAIQAADKTDPGTVAFFDAATLAVVSSVGVGALPDMVTWTKDGQRVLVANEGEPNDDYTVDPEGSVSIIDTSDIANPVAKTADFSKWNAPKKRAKLIADGVRIFGPGASVAQDLEPEYIAVADNGKTAWVTLQENNAVALIDIQAAKVKKIVALGTKDHSIAGQGLDASDKDGAINIANWPVQGYYMPDAIAQFRAGGQRYLITANEGDSRDYDGYSEEARVKDLTLDPTVFPDAAALQTDAALGRLNVTTAQGDTDGDGDFDTLYSFGGRSVSIWSRKGELLWDSGDSIEQAMAALYPANFNADHGDNAFDNRSDNKGPEPEGVTVAELWGTTYAFVGLERMSAILVYDLSEPTAPVMVNVFSTRDFTADPETAAAGDLGPEGLMVIDAATSPTGEPLLVVANEVSGTTALITLTPPAAPSEAERAR